VLDENKVREVVQKVLAAKPRGYVEFSSTFNGW
jgi:hypothetical protein